MSFLNDFKEGMGNFGSNIGIIVSSVSLFVVYVLGVGLTAVIAKIFRKKFLDNEKKESYWSDLNLKKKEMKEYFRQF
jgi:Fe2+ transport system protein B